MPRTSKPPPFGNRRLTPPPCLSDAAAIVFKRIAASVDPDHFNAADTALLVEYARAIALADQAAAELAANGAVVDGRTDPWLTVQEKCVRAIVALCARLRLSPQSRFDRLVAGTKSRPQFQWPADPDGLLALPDDGARWSFGTNGRRPPRA